MIDIKVLTYGTIRKGVIMKYKYSKYKTAKDIKDKLLNRLNETEEDQLEFIGVDPKNKKLEYWVKYLIDTKEYELIQGIKQKDATQFKLNYEDNVFKTIDELSKYLFKLNILEKIERD